MKIIITTKDLSNTSKTEIELPEAIAVILEGLAAIVKKIRQLE